MQIGRIKIDLREYVESVSQPKDGWDSRPYHEERLVDVLNLNFKFV